MDAVSWQRKRVRDLLSWLQNNGWMSESLDIDRIVDEYMEYVWERAEPEIQRRSRR